MGILNFTDIKFQSDRRGILQDSIIGNAAAAGGYNVFRFPSDVGTYGKGHYMVIHINEQIKTEFSGGQPSNGDLPTVIRDRMRRGNTPQTAVTSAIGKIFSGVSGTVGDWIPVEYRNILPDADVGGFLGGFKSGGDFDPVRFVRTIRRTTDTIALYMPDTLNFDLNQNYSSNPLTGGAFMSMAAIASVADALNKGQGSEEVSKRLGQNLSPFAARYAADAIISRLGNENLIDAGFAALTGMVANPVLEMLYSSPEFRKFSFEFLFYPRSEQEAKSVQDIINLLKFHQAPELNSQSSGFFLVPPSEFDLKFFYMGQENPNIPKISTCVLENINVDYAPNGFAAYETTSNTPTMGGTGMPVGIRLRLTFAETEIMTKQSYAETVGRQSTPR